MPHIYYLSDANLNEELVAVNWSPKRKHDEIEFEIKRMIEYYNHFDDIHISRVIVEKESYMGFNGEYKEIN